MPHRSATRSVVGLAALFISATASCAEPPTAPTRVAEQFWEAALATEYQRAASLTAGADAAAVRDTLQGLDFARAEVERHEVPPEARRAYLPTQFKAAGNATTVDSITALARRNATWRVRVTETAERVREDRSVTADERLGDTASELGASLLARIRALREDFDVESLADRYGDELSNTLESAREAIMRELEALERALEPESEHPTKPTPDQHNQGEDEST